VLGRFDFRILGPLEVRLDGAPVPVRGAKQRALIATLALHASETVSADALAEVLWGDEPPPTARTALQVQVSKLRKLLAGGDASLDTRGAGYALRVDADAIDLHRFDRLLELGRAALAEGEAARARAALADALALWRGTPLVDVDAPGLSTADLTSLEERRTAAVVARFEADLELGRHDDVVVDAEPVLAAEPMHERLHQLAALALYRAGRQGDALEVLSRLRRTLSEELGAEPGPATGDLERRILAHDPGLAVPADDDGGEPYSREGRKTVTALVWRFGPTGGHAGDPEAGRGRLGALTARAEAVAAVHGGSVLRSLADRLEVVFGLPRLHEDDAARAARAAWDLRDEGAHAGIASGEVLVEEAGETQHLRSSGPVELAERLARRASSGEVLLSPESFRLCRRAVETEPVAVVPGEGTSPAVEALRLLGVARDTSAAPPRLRSSLVGREQELGVLRQAYSRVERDRCCSLVTVLGPAGIGKSRLVAEFVAECSGARVLTGRCLPYGRDITFWPVAEIVKAAAGIEDADAPERALGRIAALVAGREDGAFVAEQVAGALGVSGVAPVPDEIFWAIRKLLEALAAERPLVLVIDDLHWADETLLDLVEHVASWAEGPVLLLGVGRPELVEARPAWGGGRLDATNLWLDPLSPDEAGELLGSLLRGAALAPEAGEQIAVAAEGNPLFLEEVLSMLVDDGLLRWEGERWVPASDLSRVPIPPSVQAILAARLDRLPAAERHVLELAAVVGKAFSEEDLSAFETGGASLDRDSLASLGDRDLLVPERTGRGARSHRFRHQLLRDVTYGAVSKEVRAQLHETFGDALEARAGERITEVEEIVAYHLEAAHRYRAELGLPEDRVPPLGERAAALLSAAGRRAVARDDMPAAASLLARALDLLPAEDARRPELGWMLAVALFDVGEPSRAEEVAAGHLELAERLGDEAATWRLRIELSDIRSYLSADLPVGEREEVAREAIEAFERMGDDRGAARAYRLLGDALSRRGQQAEGGEALLRGKELALGAGDEREAGERINVGVSHGPTTVDRCIELMSANVESSRRPNPEGLSGLGFAYAMAGRFEEAHPLVEEAVARIRDLGSEMRLASILMYAAYARLIEDDAPGAEAAARPAVESLQRMGERFLLSTAAALLGEARYRQGALDEAMLASLMSEAATAEDDVVSQMGWRSVRAKVLAARGEHRDAERLAREAVAFAAQTDLLALAGDAFADLATVLEAGGDPHGAAEALDEALERYERKGAAVQAARARERLGALRRAANG
jgi:DNA-binding SARP family transcriptional activator